MVRTERELLDMINFIEAAYPEGKPTNMNNPIVAYEIGILAGLKAAIGEYESFNEMNWQEFVESTFCTKEALCA